MQCEKICELAMEKEVESEMTLKLFLFRNKKPELLAVLALSSSYFFALSRRAFAVRLL